MAFGTFLDPARDWPDTVHCPNSLQKFPFADSGFYMMTSKVMEDFGVYAMGVSQMQKIG